MSSGSLNLTGQLILLRAYTREHLESLGAVAPSVGGEECPGRMVCHSKKSRTGRISIRRLASYVRRPELSYERMQLLDDEEAEEGKNGEDAPDDTNGK